MGAPEREKGIDRQQIENENVIETYHWSDRNSAIATREYFEIKLKIQGPRDPSFRISFKLVWRLKRMSMRLDGRQTDKNDVPIMRI